MGGRHRGTPLEVRHRLIGPFPTSPGSQYPLAPEFQSGCRYLGWLKSFLYVTWMAGMESKSNSSWRSLFAVVSFPAAANSISRCSHLWFSPVAILADNIGSHNECIRNVSSGNNANTKDRWNATHMTQNFVDYILAIRLFLSLYVNLTSHFSNFVGFRQLQIPNARTEYYEISPAYSRTPHNTTHKIASLYLEFKYHFLTLQKKFRLLLNKGVPACSLKQHSFFPKNIDFHVSSSI